MYKSNRFDESKSFIEQAIASANRIMRESDKDFVLKEISIEYTNQNDIKNALEVIDTISDQYEKDRAIRCISVSLAKQLKFDDALDYARRLSKDFSEMSLALKEISDELANNQSIEESQLIFQEAFDSALNIKYDWIRMPIIIDFLSALARFGKIDQVIEIARNIQEDDQSLKCSLLMKISTELLYQDKLDVSNTLIDEAIDNARGISVGSMKIISLLEISTELAKQAKLDISLTLMEEALSFANKKGDSWSTYDGLKQLSIEFVRQGSYSIAEKIVLGIESSSIRYYYWELISQLIIENDGFDLALNSSSYFHSDEAKLYYLRTWAQSITVNDITKDLLNKAILVLSNDSLSLERFMQVQAQYEILYGSISNEKMNRLNKTLNIQWLIDIISKFPKKETFLYTSTNVSEWIALISDVDDREEIELLARKVSKGKMTEEDFSERIKSFIN
jgi:tetratricopeptide (TPR) repeat protein